MRFIETRRGGNPKLYILHPTPYTTGYLRASAASIMASGNTALAALNVNALAPAIPVAAPTRAARAVGTTCIATSEAGVGVIPTDRFLGFRV